MWDTLHAKAFEEEDFYNSPHDYADWLVYCLMRAGGLSNGRTHKVLHPCSGDTASYWSEDGLQVWGPSADLVQQCNDSKAWNNSSFMLRLEYGGRSLVLPGDAEETAWDAVAESVGSDNMKCDILKAAHHGRDSGYSDMAVDAMSPEIVICSVGKKPSTDASHKYSSHGATVLSTRSKGTIVVKLWADGEVEVFDHNAVKIGGLPILQY
jgi:competence protein ComEC